MMILKTICCSCLLTNILNNLIYGKKFLYFCDFFMESYQIYCKLVLFITLINGSF